MIHFHIRKKFSLSFERNHDHFFSHFCVKFTYYEKVQEQECTFLHTGDNTNLNIETCGDSEKCLELYIWRKERKKENIQHPDEMFDIVSNYSIAEESGVDIQKKTRNCPSLGKIQIGQDVRNLTKWQWGNVDMNGKKSKSSSTPQNLNIEIEEDFGLFG